MDYLAVKRERGALSIGTSEREITIHSRGSNYPFRALPIDAKHVKVMLLSPAIEPSATNRSWPVQFHSITCAWRRAEEWIDGALEMGAWAAT